MKSRLGLAKMKLNQFTLPARMANKVACWGRRCRTLKPKGRLSHAWNRKFKGQYEVWERELSRGGEQWPSLPLVPQHYLFLLVIFHASEVVSRGSCWTCSAVRASWPGWQWTLFPMSQGRAPTHFCSQHCIIWIRFPCSKIFLRLGNPHDLYFRFTQLFYLLCTAPFENVGLVENHSRMCGWLP